MSYFCLYPQFCGSAYLVHIHSQLHFLQQPRGKRLFTQCWESMTFQLWTVWPRKTGCWWEWVHKGARPPQAATIYSLSYSLLTPPHDALHHQWHYFLQWKYTAARNIRCTFVLSAVTEHLCQSLSCKGWDVSPEIVWYVTTAKYIFMFSVVELSFKIDPRLFSKFIF